MIDKKQLRIILAKNIIISALFIAASVFAVSYISAKMMVLSTQIVTQKRQALEMSRRGDTYMKLQNDFASIGDIDVKIANALPFSDDISEFVSYTNSFGTQNGVNQSAQFNTSGATVVENDLATIAYSLSISATGAQLVSYLQHFERMPYFATINSLNVSGVGGADIRNGANVTMPAQLFVRQNN